MGPLSIQHAQLSSTKERQACPSPLETIENTVETEVHLCRRIVAVKTGVERTDVERIAIWMSGVR